MCATGLVGQYRTAMLRNDIARHGAIVRYWSKHICHLSYQEAQLCHWIYEQRRAFIHSDKCTLCLKRRKGISSVYTKALQWVIKYFVVASEYQKKIGKVMPNCRSSKKAENLPSIGSFFSYRNVVKRSNFLLFFLKFRFIFITICL